GAVGIVIVNDDVNQSVFAGKKSRIALQACACILHLSSLVQILKMKFRDQAISYSPTLEHPDVHINWSFQLAAAAATEAAASERHQSTQLSHHRRQRLALLRRQNDRNRAESGPKQQRNGKPRSNKPH